ncbi:hypothetical protein ACFYNY_27345 [Streptomyces sp. NPDC006530]|uniref:hypothetical protein n=1 Tax=Streptomyces sp. NPDC006530 TaxID=3364750 RepID=UPI00368D8C42
MGEDAGRRPVAVTDVVGAAVVGNHNEVHVTQGATSAVRSAYWEQVRRIAPPELVGREAELAELAAFCTTESGPAYTWWRADAWAGKTALMARFALRPPAGVRVVPFFVTARLSAQNDVVAYADVVLEQLAELAGEGIPAHLTAATREAHLLRLYGVAARACAAREERLVLLVDGLDEDRGVTTGPDAHSVASLLPERSEAGMRVIVAGRPNPPIPMDVPHGHPLRDPSIVRPLSASAEAQVNRVAMEAELKHLLASPGLERDLLGLVVAAGGGLTAPDLAELTGEGEYWVRDVLTTRAGRTFGMRVESYLLAHEELQKHAAVMLGDRRLALFRDRLSAWAEEWRRRGWGAGAPQYLQRGYFRMLRAEGDLERMAELALDAARQDRMLATTGSDADALAEIRAVEELNLERGGERALVEMLRVAVRRDRLLERAAAVPGGLPGAWAAVGEVAHALALARGLPDRGRRARALNDIARVRAEQGDREQALELLAEAESVVVERDDRVPAWEFLLGVLAETYAELGELGRARGLLVERNDEAAVWHWSPALTVVRACLDADETALALEIASAAPDPAGAEATGLVARHLALADRVDQALSTACDAEHAGFLVALVQVSAVLRERGRQEEADLLFERIRRVPRSAREAEPMFKALIRAGDLDRAWQVARGAERHGGFDKSRMWVVYTTELAAVGAFDLAEDVIARLRPLDRARASGPLAVALAKAGEFDRAESVARGDRDRDALAEVAAALTAAGHVDRALELAEDVVVGYKRHAARVRVVAALAATGDRDRAGDLARSLPYWKNRADVLIAVARPAAKSGDRASAVALLTETEAGMHAAPDAMTRLRTLCRAARALAGAGHGAPATAVLADVERVHADVASEEASEARARTEITGEVADALAAAGEIDRAEAYFRDGLGADAAPAGASVDDGPLLFDAEQRPVMARIARAVAARGDTEGAWERAASLPRGLRESALAGVVVELAGAGRDDEARRLAGELSGMVEDGPGREGVGELAAVRLALGDAEGAAALLADLGTGTGLRPGVSPVVLTTLLTLGQGDRAVELATAHRFHETLPRAYAELIEACAAAGDTARAEALLASAGLTGEYAARACAALAVASAPVRARLLAARALLHGAWTTALPALLRLEPAVAPVVVELLRAGPGH